MPIVNIPKGTPDWDIPINQNFETLQTEKVGLDSNGKIDKSLIPDDIGGLENFQEKHTYAELATLIAEKKLVPGMQYVLMDYQTKYIQPVSNVLKTSTVEKLVLTAIDESHFSPECSSISYPQDIITYDFNMNKCEDSTTLRNGFITWRKSTNTTGNFCNISLPGDWRTMKVARYTPNPNNYRHGSNTQAYKTWQTGATVTYGDVYKYNTALYKVHTEGTPNSATDSNYFYILYDNINTAFLPAATNYTVSYSRTTNIDLIGERLVEYDVVASNCYNINAEYSFYSLPTHFNTLFLSGCNNIHLGEGCINNTFGARVSHVNMDSGCTDNMILSDSGHIKLSCKNINNVVLTFCNKIELGINCTGNIFNYRCYDISIGNACSGNYFGTNCYSVNFLDNCTANRLYDKDSVITFGSFNHANKLEKAVYGIQHGFGCGNNSYDLNSHNNTLTGYCNSNKFGSGGANVLETYCNENTFSGSNEYNFLGPYCYKNVFGVNSSRNFFTDFCFENKLGNNCTGNFFFPGVISNTFGNNKCYIAVKNLYQKDISNITALNNSLGYYNYTIESDNSQKYCYWYINSSGQLVRTLIP